VKTDRYDDGTTMAKHNPKTVTYYVCVLQKHYVLTDKAKVCQILWCILYGCETWSLSLREKQRLRVSESRQLMVGRTKLPGVTVSIEIKYVTNHK
jgi:hypothetical protein